MQGYFYAWSRDEIFASLNYTFVMASREAAGREASPTAGVIDSQSVKTAYNMKRVMRILGVGGLVDAIRA